LWGQCGLLFYDTSPRPGEGYVGMKIHMQIWLPDVGNNRITPEGIA